MIETITSRKNQRIKEAAGLVRSAESRRAQGLFVVEGARLCYDALRSGVPVQQLFFTPQAREKYGDYVEPLVQAAQAAFCTEPHAAELLVRHQKQPGGSLPSAPKSPGSPWKRCRKPAAIWAWEALQDPGNLGAVMRTAEALGIAGLVLFGECCDVYNPKALRAGMGGGLPAAGVSGGLLCGDCPSSAPPWVCHLRRRAGCRREAGNSLPLPGALPAPGGERGQRPAAGDHRGLFPKSHHSHEGPGRVLECSLVFCYPYVGDDALSRAARKKRGGRNVTAEEERELLYWLFAQRIFGCGSAQPMHFFQLYGSMTALF